MNSQPAADSQTEPSVEKRASRIPTPTSPNAWYIS